jgi:nickel-type superoxide dismutase maturation protease
MSKTQPILPKTSYFELLLLLLRRRKRLKIVGKSMLPLLQPGNEILIDPYAYKKSSPKLNDIVVTKHPQQPEITIVKRVTAIDDRTGYFLTGDNLADSTDSRHWGSVKSPDILGKVTSYFC